jgi:hypothetical protein
MAASAGDVFGRELHDLFLRWVSPNGLSLRALLIFRSSPLIPSIRILPFYGSRGESPVSCSFSFSGGEKN